MGSGILNAAAAPPLSFRKDATTDIAAKRRRGCDFFVFTLSTPLRPATICVSVASCFAGVEMVGNFFDWTDH